MLRIKRNGTARDTDFGMIKGKDGNYRPKTEDDKALIEQYTNIFNKALYIDDTILDLVNKINNNDITDENLLMEVEQVYRNQIQYLFRTKSNLENFYEEKDTKDIIKNGYPSAYSVIQAKIDDSVLYDRNDVKLFIEAIKRNNRLISQLRIKSYGTARDTDYGVILDPTTELGFRSKTDEDKALIDEYTNILGTLKTYPEEFITLLEQAQSKINTQSISH